MEYVTLNNGVKMPILGYGVYQVTKEECERCVLDALKVGYRAIDTAQSYFNERGVGEGVRTCGIPREDLFVVSKVAQKHRSRQITSGLKVYLDFKMYLHVIFLRNFHLCVSNPLLSTMTTELARYLLLMKPTSKSVV